MPLNVLRQNRLDIKIVSNSEYLEPENVPNSEFPGYKNTLRHIYEI